MRDSAEQLYREHIIDHYRNPRRFGFLDPADAVHRESNFSCGDDLEFSVRVAGGKVTDLRFRGQGCALSVAAASMLAEKAVGLPVADLLAMTESDIVRMLGVGELSGSRLRCAALGLKGIRTALAGLKPAGKKPALRAKR